MFNFSLQFAVNCSIVTFSLLFFELAMQIVDNPICIINLDSMSYDAIKSLPLASIDWSIQIK